jgi:NTP pyrophosphatase (non-canonical NTP hydrolase)
MDTTEVRQALQRFARDRAGAPREVVEREYGDLLLYLIRLAANLNVDLITAAARQLPVTPSKVARLKNRSDY